MNDIDDTNEDFDNYHADDNDDDDEEFRRYQNLSIFIF